jgi:UDP-N-acetylmuramate--alanine ligase
VDPVFVDAVTELPAILGSVLEKGDVLLTLGAGDIGAAATKLPEQLRREGP